jgi:hypothetical protein
VGEFILCASSVVEAFQRGDDEPNLAFLEFTIGCFELIQLDLANQSPSAPKEREQRRLSSKVGFS